MKRRTKPAAVARDPWTGVASRAAGLPRDGAAWTAVLLAAIRATATHPRTVARLRELGYDLGADEPARATVARWYRWLAAQGHELPPRTSGAQVGDPPPPRPKRTE